MKKRFIRAGAAALVLIMAVASGAYASVLDWFLGSPEQSAAVLPDATPEVSLPGTTEQWEIPLPTMTPAPEGTGLWDDVWPLPTEVPTAAPEAPLPDCAIRDDGWLRVYLRSLSDAGQLHLELSGVYAVESDPGFRFDRDTEITLTAADGEVWMSAGGLTIDMGSGVTLTRHADGAEGANGILIREAVRKDALYCGDLSVSATDSGTLRAILKIRVEDYLYGVVAYEMSDSFPPEALKAQAVAARTYAMQRKWSAGTRDYDLVDTTADQVFRGYVAEYVSVIDAVDATRGVVGIYDGGFATCYYTASNGGQTALASQIWGGTGADGYLAMADDPWDLENPHSPENDLTFTAQCEGSLKLKQMLTAALKDVMSAEGFEQGEWAFDSIAAIKPINPKFDGSYMYRDLAFDLRVRLPESAVATAAPESVDMPAETAATEEPEMAAAPQPERWVVPDETRRVTLSVYSQIKDGLSMGLNGSDCEVIAVETVPGADGSAQSFRLVMRRYGHGVGMSQRGAQWAAGEYGRTWREILAFYYPGMSLERMDWGDDGLTELGALPVSVGAARPKPTAKPTPAPLPTPAAGEYVATVTATSLNVREKPGTAARILDVLESGREVLVSGEADADGWVSVRTAEISGYVKLEYLKRK